MKELKNIFILTPRFTTNENDVTCMPYLQTYLQEVSKEKHHFKFTAIPLQYPNKSRTYLWNGIQVFSGDENNRSFPLRFYYWRKLLKDYSH
jgi:hypothetical protein